MKKSIICIAILFIWSCNENDPIEPTQNTVQSTYTINGNEYETDSISRTVLPGKTYYVIGSEPPTVGLFIDTVYVGEIDPSYYLLCLSVQNEDSSVTSFCSNSNPLNQKTLTITGINDSLFSIDYDGVFYLDASLSYPDTVYNLSGNSINLY